MFFPPPLMEKKSKLYSISLPTIVFTLTVNMGLQDFEHSFGLFSKLLGTIH